MNTEPYLKFVKGATFAYNAKRGQLLSNESLHSFESLIKELDVNTITLPISAWQDNAQSVEIDYKSDDTPSDFEIENFIDFAHQKSVRVVLKPIINLKDGTSRSFIDFYDNKIPIEPTWSQWFENYRSFILHMARIASETGCSIFSVGSQLTKSEARVAEWRDLITDVKNIYGGFITYCSDSYFETTIQFWDMLDIISSCGFYSPHSMNAEFTRIDKMCKKLNKPFLFLDCGCRSVTLAGDNPRKIIGENSVNQEEQAYYFRTLFNEIKNRNLFCGFSIFEWPIDIYNRINAENDKSYCVYGKQASKIIYSHHK